MRPTNPARRSSPQRLTPPRRRGAAVVGGRWATAGPASGIAEAEEAAVPHDRQNLASGAIAAPQFAQNLDWGATAAGVCIPQRGQNLAPSRIWAPQFEQYFEFINGPAGLR